MSPPIRIAMLGFSEFERQTLGSFFRLTLDRKHRYEAVLQLADSDYIVADADHAATVQLVAATDRLSEALFIGIHPPAGALAWMKRPIDPLHVIRELDALVLQGQAHEPVDEQVRAGSAQPRRPPPGPTALLVDDSAIALRFLQSRLAPWGLRCDTATTSGKALEWLSVKDYDIVFLDVELGQSSAMDGLGLCQRIKRIRDAGAMASTSVIMVSAHHAEVDRVQGSLAGCDGYLGKPLQGAELARLLSRQGLMPTKT